jgi:hypothetical protein
MVFSAVLQRVRGEFAAANHWAAAVMIRHNAYCRLSLRESAPFRGAKGDKLLPRTFHKHLTEPAHRSTLEGGPPTFSRLFSRSGPLKVRSGYACAAYFKFWLLLRFCP